MDQGDSERGGEVVGVVGKPRPGKPRPSHLEAMRTAAILSYNDDEPFGGGLILAFLRLWDQEPKRRQVYLAMDWKWMPLEFREWMGEWRKAWRRDNPGRRFGWPRRFF